MSSLYSSSSIIEFDDEDGSLDPALIEACISNDVAAVQAELVKGTEINNIDHREYTALHLAVENESFDVLKLLLKQPSSIRKNEQCYYYDVYTPLALACAISMNINCILELIAAGCNLDLSNLDVECPLLLLIQNENMEWEKKKIVIEALIQNGADLDRPKILNELIIAYDDSKECLEILHLFLYYNIDVNSNSAEALTMAIRNRHFDICDILWDYIADFTADSDEPDELFFLSIRYGYKCNEILDKCVDISIGNFFEEDNNILHAFFYSTGENVDEILNTLWMRFEARDNVAALIENVYLALSYDYCDYFTYSPNKACVIRFFNLYFNLLFETQSDGFDLFCFYPLYRLFKLIELDKDEMLKMFYSYLMCNSRISYEQLKLLYQNCSKDEFETFLKINVNIDVDKYDMDFTFNKDIRDPDLLPLDMDNEVSSYLSNIEIYDVPYQVYGMEYKIDLLKLPRCKETYTKFDCILYPDLLPLDMEDEDVPSLLKLSRNVIRKQFQPNYKTMIKEDLVYFRYYNKVNNLDVPKHIKDILLLNVML